MDSWQPHLHWSFHQEHVLFDGLVLRSFTDFVVAALFLTVICLVERFLSFKVEQSQSPRFLAKTRWGKRMWWSTLYWTINFLRLCYMLAAMTLQIGLIIVIVTSLTLGQSLVEIYKSRDDLHDHSASGLIEDADSRTSLIPSSYPLRPVTERTQPRSKSRPHGISIHPIHSNIARTKATTSQLCINGDTESVEYSGDKIPEGKIEARNDSKNSAKEKKDEKSFLISGSDSDSESGS